MPFGQEGAQSGERGSRRRADENFARAGFVLELDRRRRRRARDDELSMGRLDDEEVTGSRVDAGRHPELHLAD